jgi:predicted MFS family arabinose efflux permease
LDRLGLFFAVNYFAQGMSGIAYEPLSYLLKDGFGLGPAQSAAFVSWMTLPFLLKPLFGAVSDAGFRTRRSALVFSGALACLAWLTLALAPSSYSWTLLLLIASNCGLVLGDVACDAVMVEKGKASARTGVFQSIQIATLYGTIVVTGLGGGWLAAHASMRQVFALSGAFAALSLGAAFWVPSSSAAKKKFSLLPILSSKTFWSLSLFIFLWSFAPFLGTAQFYFQSEGLGLSPVFIGTLGTIGGLAGMAGAAAYGKFARSRPLAWWLKSAVWAGAPLALLYAAYRGPVSAALITAATGFGGVLFRLAIMDLAARSAPEGLEATSFSAYMAVFNLAAWASNGLGGAAYAQLKASWA